MLRPVQRLSPRGIAFSPVAIRKSPLVVICRAAVIVGLFWLVLSLCYFALFSIGIVRNWSNGIVAFLFLLSIFAGLWYFWLEWYNKCFFIQQDELIYHAGVFNHTELNFSLGRIQSISLSQGLLGRIFGFGTLRVFFHLGEEVYLRDIPDVKSILQCLEDLAIKSRSSISK
ncbi:MAG: PH domain-containing protein [Candidatus Abawacabacteria bacterium]|nr:PH domain-containing protein [Candidatus Abawacabacteria bacterium]